SARADHRDGRGAQRGVAHARGARVQPRGAEALREVWVPARRRAPPLLLRQQRGRAHHVDGASSRPSGARSSREAQERAGERAIRILAIETSCDETGVAIVEDGRRIRSNIVASQLVHQDTGGIVPEVAAREHLRAIDALTEKALGDAGCQLTEIDAIAATVGPGLIGCLLVGANYARGLALSAGLPFVGVNHLEGHVYANWLEEREATPEPELPAVVLVVSGAHSDLVLMEAHRRFRPLGRTIDDAAGEPFDKVARLLHLGFPAGALHRQRRDDRRRGLLRAAAPRDGDPRRGAQRSQARVTKEELSAALAEAQARAKADGSGNDVPEIVLRILTAASTTGTVRD